MNDCPASPIVQEYISIELTAEQERSFMPFCMDERLPQTYDEARDEILKMIATKRLHMKITMPQYPTPVDQLEYEMLKRIGADMAEYRLAKPSDLPRIMEFYDFIEVLRGGAAK